MVWRSSASKLNPLRWSLRVWLLIYLIAIHVLFAGVALGLLFEHQTWLFVVELVFAGSLFIGYRLVQAFFVPLELIRLGADMLEEEEFTVHFRPVGQPEFDRLLGVYNAMVDRLRDERVRGEEQNALLERVIHVSASGIVIGSLDGAIMHANPAAKTLLGLPPQRTLAGTSPDSYPLLASAMALAPGDSTVVPRAGGQRLRLTHSAFRDRGFARSLIVIDELTEELRQSEKDAYSKIIRLISHEVNNSVGPVLSLVDTIGHYADRLDAEDRARFEQGIDLAAQRLDHLRGFVEGFADVVKLPPPQRAPCDLDRVLADVLQLMEPELNGRGVDCQRQARTPLGERSVDKNQIEQVLVNILKNAAEATGQGGTVTVTTDHRRGASVLEIADDGPGLAPEVERQLFQPFFTSKDQGRGLGLTVVQEVLRGHGFPFSLRNGVAGGAVFRIDFGG